MAKTKTAKPRIGELHAVIGQKLRMARLKHGISQVQLGEQIGVTFQQIQKYERGANRIDLTRLIQCARILNVDLAHFTGSVVPKRGNGSTSELDAVMATREGAGIIKAMVKMTLEQRKFIVDLARRLSREAA